MRFDPHPVQCQFCGSRNKLTLDHVIPTASGGTDEPDNIQVLCKHCHTLKNLIREYRIKELVEATRGVPNNTKRTEEYHQIRKSF